MRVRFRVGCFCIDSELEVNVSGFQRSGAKTKENKLGNIFVDQVFGQGFDQGLGEMKTHKTQSTVLPGFMEQN